MHDNFTSPNAHVAQASAVRPSRSPPAEMGADSAEAMQRLREDHDRIVADITNVVAHRLFSAGLTLQSALGLMDGHPAANRVEVAIGELDQAIRELRDAVLRPRRSGWLARRQTTPGPGGLTAKGDEGSAGAEGADQRGGA